VQQAANELELVAKRALLRPETAQQRMWVRGFTSQPLEDGMEGDLDQRVVALGTDPEFGEGAAQELQLELIARVEFEKRRDASYKPGESFPSAQISVAGGADGGGRRRSVVDQV
jgi:hypothetical protein